MLSFFPRILTYRLMLYYLALLLACCLALGAAGMIAIRPSDLAFSALVAAAACWSVNWIFARSFGAVSHNESVLITALILTFLITPFSPQDTAAIGFCLFASAWAMASKYLLAIHKRHIFNPAALGVALAAMALHRTVSWWVGDYSILLPVIVAGGVLLLLRLRYFDLLASFSATVLAILLITGGPAQIASAASQIMLHSMFCFFAFVMLTEPRTTPVGPWRHIALGVTVGILFSPIAHVGRYYFTPEVAILAGNIFTFLSNRRRMARWAAHLRQSPAVG